MHAHTCSATIPYDSNAHTHTHTKCPEHFCVAVYWLLPDRYTKFVIDISQLVLPHHVSPVVPSPPNDLFFFLLFLHMQCIHNVHYCVFITDGVWEEYILVWIFVRSTRALVFVWSPTCNSIFFTPSHNKIRYATIRFTTLHYATRGYDTIQYDTKQNVL